MAASHFWALSAFSMSLSGSGAVVGGSMTAILGTTMFPLTAAGDVGIAVPVVDSVVADFVELT